MSDHGDSLTTTPERGGPPAAGALPSHVGRYRVERLLGEGGFGRVFLARDEQLERRVAVKVPHRHLVASADDARAYLDEARTAANLDHPHIVPVFDYGSDAEFPCFIVSKYVEGRTLAAAIRHDRPAPAAAAALVAAVADALQHAHQRGVVHRDLKPGNILLDAAGRPYVADFGLALREQDVGHGPRYAGTPAYMSPEQARGEGHRVDGRSDVFSLGVVFYELLTGRRPFQAGSRDELLEQVASREPRPPRQWDDAIPKELERICLKALAKRAAERYTTARDLADDLRPFLASAAADPAPAAGRAGPTPAGPAPAPPTAATAAGADPASPTAATSGGLGPRVMPRGLRAFDAHDTDFFLGLLPGPRDRDGLPDSIRFWKTRIEETDPDNTFAVGLLCGPSGCGKSSLVKAGLLPRLADHVTALYVEATPDDTEARLRRALHKHVPGAGDGPALADCVAALRGGRGPEPGRKVLLVLDQFEQWLHAHPAGPQLELVRALRQCDGGRVQALLLVRDDFWMAVTRFMRELEVRLLDGQNSAAADLFDADHAARVLTLFGRAFGRLPERGSVPAEQRAFVGQAVAALAEDGKVICVRLALLAEMMKGRPWTPASLREVGGVEGVGATFLEETFAGRGAPPEHRYHAQAARQVLRALLPEAGSDLRGGRRSRQELQAAAGYAARPKEFAELLRILDGEVRLITPADAEGEGAPGGEGHYQLTHDYLVPSLREWLTRKQRERARGRAELRLAERAALWATRPRARHLPAWWEWLNIRLLTRKTDWTAPQKAMMRKAARHYGLRGGLLAVLLALLTLGGLMIRNGVVEQSNRARAEALVEHLLSAETAELPPILAELERHRAWVGGPLRRAEAEASGDERKRLHLSLALLAADDGQAEYLFERLLTADPQAVGVIQEALLRHAGRGALAGRLWPRLMDPDEGLGRRLRAACALAPLGPGDARWDDVAGALAAGLVSEKALLVPAWTEALRPVGRHLLPQLATFLGQDGRGDDERRAIAGIYQQFAGEDRAEYARLEEQLTGPPAQPRVADIKRRAHVAVALAVMGRGGRVWPLLEFTPDPTLRSYLIERLGAGGVEVGQLRGALLAAQSPRVRYALILALGGIPTERLSAAELDDLAKVLLGLYERDSDPGVHGAAEWVLRHWRKEDALAAAVARLRQRRAAGPRGWYVNGGWGVNDQGRTFAILGPDVFEMGQAEFKHKETLEVAFAIASKEVTVREFLEYDLEHPRDTDVAPHSDDPVNRVSWHQAAAYCNWRSKGEGLDDSELCYEQVGKDTFRLVPGWQRRSGYRLPTEAEWEFACRARAVTRWAYGEGIDEVLKQYARCNLHGYEDYRPTCSAVGSLRPNDFGLFDMHGNVAEWCLDFRAAARQPAGKEGTYAIRGGSFSDRPAVVQCTSSFPGPGQGKGSAIGFRLARSWPR